MKVKSVSHVRLLATPWTAAYQAPLPMGFSRHQGLHSRLCSLTLQGAAPAAPGLLEVGPEETRGFVVGVGEAQNGGFASCPQAGEL